MDISGRTSAGWYVLDAAGCYGPAKRLRISSPGIQT